MDAKRIGERLQKLRGDKTQEAVARDLGVSPSAVGMYESGERIPRDDVKIRITDTSTLYPFAYIRSCTHPRLSLILPCLQRFSAAATNSCSIAGVRD